jgi:hypothetical protein
MSYTWFREQCVLTSGLFDEIVLLPLYHGCWLCWLCWLCVGFLTHHLALTLSFDASLRAVDPSVILPYWDFTIEGQQIKDLGELVCLALHVFIFSGQHVVRGDAENEHTPNAIVV